VAVGVNVMTTSEFLLADDDEKGDDEDDAADADADVGVSDLW